AGTSVMSLACGLLAKSSNLAKVSVDELLLPVMFAESLHQIEPEWAHTLAVTTWENDAVEITETAFQKSDLIVVYGSDETIEKIREKVPPTARAIYHGHKLSLGIIARERIDAPLAEQAAVDISLYDQRGCLSPHLYYVEKGGAASPIEFAQWLAQALYVASYQLPKGPTSPDEAAKIQQLRGALPLKGGRVFPSPKGLDWTVLYDPDPGFSISPLARTIWVKPVEELTRIPFYLEPIRPYLQAVGVAVPTDRQPQIVPALARMGATRICPIGKMQKPPMTWHHDGRFRLLNLLRFVDWENP
ncbi:MAG TPA: acyl-CoA reductase, partial [Candidatus Manganitrophaceae bacterium]|nr:acyl-CoA reductase [Candidatus Manganitrophaceae bacterium]